MQTKHLNSVTPKWIRRRYRDAIGSPTWELKFQVDRWVFYAGRAWLTEVQGEVHWRAELALPSLPAPRASGGWPAKPEAELRAYMLRWFESHRVEFYAHWAQRLSPKKRALLQVAEAA